MPAGDIALLIVNILGGLAFFIYGMKVVSESLQELAGGKLRDLLFRLTRNRMSGLTVGTLLGFAIHSGAATLLLVTFINAGMLTLENSIAVMLGANIGTTLSMQLISFKVGQWALAAVAVGLLMKLGSRKERWRHIGMMLFGFGLIFLGMETMSGAVGPLKENGMLESVLQLANARTTWGFGLLLLLSLIITGIFQSSGATIGVAFALCQADVFTDLRQVFPIVLGAHIGTCSATLLGSIGTNIEARRSAYSHLGFNVAGTAAAWLMAPFYFWLIPLTSDVLVRQVANAHTLVQLINSLLLLPFAPLVARVVRRLSPSSEKPPELSYLDQNALETPERAIAAAMRESRRMAGIVRQMLVQAMSGLLRRTSKPFALVLQNEHVVDALKRSVNDYLLQIARRKLSTRQSILLQHLMSTTSDLERIGDHIETVVNTTEEKVAKRVWFDQESVRLLAEQYQRVDRLLRLTILSLDPDLGAFKQISKRMLELRRDFVTANRMMRARHRQLILEHHETPINGLYYELYLRCFERIVRHTKSIARVEQESFFKVKPQKFELRTEEFDSLPSAMDNPLPVDERMLNEELTFDDLGLELGNSAEASEPTPAPTAKRAQANAAN